MGTQLAALYLWIMNNLLPLSQPTATTTAKATATATAYGYGDGDEY